MTPDASTAATALLAVHSVDEFVFSVPDLEAARQFYASFGLTCATRTAAGAVRLRPSAALGPHPAGGGTQAAVVAQPGHPRGDAPRFAERLDQQGIARITAPAGADDGGIWIAGPDGLPLQLRAAPKSSPSAPAPQTPPQPCANAGRAPARSRAPRVQPLYLSHILLFSADVARATRFYVDMLGLRVSDTSGDVIAFLHSPHGSDHHLIALAKSGGLGLHHTSWCVASLDDVGLGMEQMSAAGHGEGWGVGRHVLGSNYFRYVRDPGAATPSIPTTSISSRPARHGPRPTIRPRTRCTSGAGPAPGLHHEPRTGRLSGGCPTPTGNEAGVTPRPPAAPAAPQRLARAAPRP